MCVAGVARPAPAWTAQAEQDAGERICHGPVETLLDGGGELAIGRRGQDHGPAGAGLVQAACQAASWSAVPGKLSTITVLPCSRPAAGRG